MVLPKMQLSAYKLVRRKGIQYISNHQNRGWMLTLLEKRLMYALSAQAEDEKILEQQNRFCTLLLLHFESGK